MAAGNIYCWQTLKQKVTSAFHEVVDSGIIHELLRRRKKQSVESYLNFRMIAKRACPSEKEVIQNYRY